MFPPNTPLMERTRIANEQQELNRYAAQQPERRLPRIAIKFSLRTNIFTRWLRANSQPSIRTQAMER